MVSKQHILGANPYCCRKSCVVIYNHFLAQVRLDHLKHFESLLKRTQRQELLSRVEACCAKKKDLYLTYEYTAGDPVLHSTKLPVCREAFCRTYNITDNQLQGLAKKVKNKETVLDSSLYIPPSLNSTEVDVLTNPSKAVEKYCEELHVEIEPTMRGYANLRDTALDHVCYAWLKTFFDNNGDAQPNAEEIHMDPIPKLVVFEEFKNDISVLNNESRDGVLLPVHGYRNFCDLWNRCFDYVKIREYKNVSGKCNVCAAFSVYKQKVKNKDERDILLLWSSFHRATLMQERNLYLCRSMQARNYPTQYLSMITDGMAMARTKVPVLSNLASTIGLDQHIQGIILHDRRRVVFRSFENISKGANLQIHTMLKAIEHEYEKSNCKIFIVLCFDSSNVLRAKLILCIIVYN